MSPLLHRATVVRVAGEATDRGAVIVVSSWRRRRIRVPVYRSAAGFTARLGMHSKVHHHEEPLFFFGETYRECFGLLHVVTACKLILLVEVAKIFAEFFFITYRFGSVDAVTVTHYTATVTAMICVMVGLLKERYILFWPFLVLKALETILCLIAALGIMVLVVVGSAGRRLLVRAVRWRYRSLQDSHAIGVAFLFFFLFVFLFLLNALIVKVMHKSQHYVHKKTMTQYLLNRRDVLHSIMRR